MVWPVKEYAYDDLKDVLQNIDLKKTRLDKHRPLSRAVVQSIRSSLNLEWTYNSNSIEGNTLNLRETRMVIEEGMTVAGKSLREHFEVVNHQEAIEYLEELVSGDYLLKERDILDIHELVLSKIEKEFAGRYRNSGVRIPGANFTPPNALKVPDLMSDLISWVSRDDQSMHPLVRVSIFHHRFVWIHPFFDGNGRTVRLIMNLLLMKWEFPPVIILKVDRNKYYQALNRANQGHYDLLIRLIARAADRSLGIYLSNLEDYADEYVPIADLVVDAALPYGQEYISLLARQGKIDSYKEGRIWYTRPAAIKEYIDNRKRERKLLLSG
ncbi:MAG: Fic family protein [Saprospiraceae bacterium]|uniref:Fic family protein n=1 Tax=Candidatus Defluviibacterium haderslevense TaxID=2981993 RepID=A0A9D7S5F9_9BACT|nr:Fic family protein [Candidatus Defluviibacterium haderslevense]